MLEKEKETIIKSRMYKKYPIGLFVYVIELENGIYKIGRTRELNKRLRVYNTGRVIPLDYSFTIETNDAKCVEGCVISMLYSFRYNRRKEQFRCNLDLIIKTIKKCVEIDNICSNKELQYDAHIANLQEDVNKFTSLLS